MKTVPDRWLDYSNIGQVIPGTPFIACKTPLKESLTSESRFTPEDLIESVKGLGKNLVLVIDLTYTTRYYNKKEFKNISHVKIFTRGHVVPSPDRVSQFFETVDSFMKNLGKDDTIVVHCTHGVNRTGYFICKYMIDKLNFDPHKAIEEFNAARGHKIERKNYISSLKSETIEIPSNRVYTSRPEKEMVQQYPHQRWSVYNRNERPSQNQNFNNRYRYQDHRRFSNPPNSYRYENPSFSMRDYSSRYQPYYQHQHHQYDSYYEHSADHYYSHGGSNYKYQRNTFYDNYSSRPFRSRNQRWKSDRY